MIALFSSSLILSFLLLILGVSLSKKFRLTNNLTESILLGLVVLNTTTSFLSVFFPINIYILVALFSCCCLLSFYIRKELIFFIYLLKSKKIIILCSSPFIFLAFIISITQPQNWDTGLYHLQSIKWIEEYRVLPGLANLHGRFGFNPNIFTVFSLTSLSELFGQEIFSVNFTLFSMFVLYFINALYLIFKKESVSNYFILNLIVFITILNLSDNLSSPTPDFIAITFPLYIFTRLTNSACLNNKSVPNGSIPILILCMYVLTVKLSTLPILILPFLLFLKLKLENRKLLCASCTLIVLPWLIRNVILTGWLVYPFPMLDLFNFDWKVSLAQVQYEKSAIYWFAKSHGANDAAYSGNMFEWAPLWWHQLSRLYKIIFLSSIIFPPFILLTNLFKRGKIEFFTFVIIFTSFIGVLFWFMLAPDLRFGKAFIVFAAISPLLYYRFKIQLYWKHNFKMGYPFFLLIIIILFFFGKNNTGFNMIRIAHENSQRIILPQIIETPENVKFKTYLVGGISIFAPTDGDRCFDHCLPCTGYPDTSLTLRGPTVQSGFKNGKSKL